MTTTVTITLQQDASGNLSASTDLAAPAVGAPLSPVQSLGLSVVSYLKRNEVFVQHGAKHVPALNFAMDMTSPEQYGWIVPIDIRNHARQIINRSQRWIAKDAS